ncbi:MAG TPA: 50S ribosomal protein L23 [Patescibacteria group bacterium]
MKTFFVQPLITEKSMAKTADGVYQFVVPTWATKRQIAEFIGRTFNVTVVNVTTALLRGENVRFRQRLGKQSTYKKATVRLVKGDTIGDFSLPVESETAPMGKTEADAVTESKITVRNKKTAQKAGA